jgi:hypothetical protein
MRTTGAALVVGLVLGITLASCSGRPPQQLRNPNALPASQRTHGVVFGTRPAAYAQSDLVGQGYRIYTPMELSYWRVLLDRRTQPTTEYDTEGGQVGDDTYVINVPHPQAVALYLLAFAIGTGITATANGSAVFARNVMVVYGEVPVDAQLVAHFAVSGPEPWSQVEPQLASCPTKR